MFTEVVPSFKSDGAEKNMSKKMILVAKDYVHLLQKKERNNTEICLDPVKVDGAFVSSPTLGQLLASLSDDLRCATSIFLEEFIVCGGVECLLDVLKSSVAQQSQSTLPATPRQQQTAIRRALGEQYDCLMCLKFAMKNTKSMKRILSNCSGISTITSCIMTSSAKIRILSLELLCQVANCNIGGDADGHTLILESFTANRVIFGEPIRFKFLVGMIHGAIADKPLFQTVSLKFLNTILKTSSKPSERIRLQCEIEEAGFNIRNLESALRLKSVSLTDDVWDEIADWKKSYLDMESVTGQKKKVESENEKLQKEVQLLRKALRKLEEDKINLMQIELELKEKCDDLNDEVSTLKTEMKQKTSEKKITNLDSGFTKEINFRRFGDDDDDLFMSSGDSGQLEHEEIVIDVPTIRPPIEFCTDSDSLKRNSKTILNKDPSKIVDKTHLLQYQIGQTANIIGSNKLTVSNNSSDKESADSALSESESDSGVNWNYPEIPEATDLSRNSRSRNRFVKDGDVNVFFRCATKTLRSKSEDRRDSFDSRSRLVDGETKLVETNGFFMKKRPEVDSTSRQSSLPNREAPMFSRYQQPVKSVTPSYQLPVAYRSNFLARGHSNCDLYSGLTPATVEPSPSPSIPPPDYAKGYSVANSGGTISALVHREITKAVRQISGWI